MQTATRTVLLIEDSPEDRSIIYRYIERDSNQTYTLVEAKGGAEGLRACQASLPDVILLDYYLPDMDGRTFLELIQRNPDTALLPVVVIAGKSSEELALETLRRGAVEYIIKDGLTPESLRLALHAAIEKGQRREVEARRIELEQANRLLREQQAQLRLALEAARMHTWEIDLQQVTSIQGEYLDSLLNKIAPVANSNVSEKLSQIHPDDRKGVTEALQGVVARKMPYDLTYRLLRPDETVRWISIRGNVVRDELAMPLRLTGVSMDVTNQKQLEEVAHEQQQAFQMVAENSPDIIARFDRELRHTYVNPAVTRATGKSIVDYLGKSNRELGMPAPKVDLWDAALEAVFATGEEGTIEFGFSAPDGQHWYQSKLAPERDQRGEIASVLSVARDVTALRQAHEDLSRSEARARGLMDSNIIGVIVAQGSTVVEANDAFLELIGAGRDELEQGRIDWVAMTPPEYAAQDEHALDELRIQEVCTPFEKEYIHRDGHPVPVLLGAATLQQDPLQWVCFILDLSLRKQAEQERAGALTAFQTLAEHAPDVITRHDATTFRYLYANPAIEQATGIPAQNFPGHTYRELGMPEDLCNMFDQTLNQVATTHQPTRVIYEARNRSYLSLLVPEEDAAHQLISILVISHDITTLQAEHQQTEGALSALISVAHALVSGADKAREDRPEETQVWVLAAQRLLEVICRTFGRSGALMVVLVSGTDVIDRLIVSGFEQDIEQRLQETVHGQLLSQRFDDASVLARLKAGEVVSIDLSQPPYLQRRPRADPYESLFVPMRLGGTLVGVITLHAAEHPRSFSEEEIVLAAAMGNLAALLIERERFFLAHEEAHTRELAAREAARQMDSFLGIVSHELKTPLTAIKANLQLAVRHLKRLPTQDTQYAAETESATGVLTLLTRAQRQLEMQNRLVNDLIDVSRIQVDRLELRIELCDVTRLVRDVVEDHRLLTPSRQIDLYTMAAELLVFADAGRVEQVITNYLTNALKYSETNRAVEVHLSIEGAMARVAVHDQGPGLTPEQQEHIWELFYRVPGIQVKSGSGIGLGLGLHICKQLIERQGGQVGVESVRGQGSTFWFTLPRTQ